jgi:pyruvate,water dikinase
VGRLTNWLGKAKAKPKEERPGVPLLVKYARYKELLAANSAVLGLIGDVQSKVSEGFLFDMHYVRTTCQELSGHVRNLAHSLVEMSGGRFQALLQVQAEIAACLAGRLAPPLIEPGPLSYPLAAIPAEAFQAGGKAEKLGRLARLGLPVPAGFVVTAYGQRLFFEQSGLASVIEEELASSSIRDLESLRRAGRNVRRRLLEAPLPGELEAELQRQAAALGERLAVRSSAIHEDSHFSFAGQFETALNVTPAELGASYKEILASQFTPRALYYCHANGFSFEEMSMGVLVMEMIAAQAAGVLYSTDPERPQEQVTIINGVWGLGTLAVGGEVSSDVYHIDGRGCCRVEVGDKIKLACCLPAGGVALREADAQQRTTACLSEAQALELARLGERAQAFFGSPQDMEWALDTEGRLFILQSRPLRIKGRPAYLPPIVKGAEVLIAKATIASRGAAAGSVHLAGEFEEEVPEGCVLIARSPSPEYAVHLGKVRAMVCEVGSATSHLATVLREARVPGLFGAKGARELLQPGQEVTVDAHYGNIYRGRVEELLAAAPADTGLHETRPYRALEAALKDVVPLNLTDPRSPEFRAANCRTYHDITRFAHEMAMRELFEVPAGGAEAQRAKRLTSDIPMDIQVIDLGGGLAPEAAARPAVTPADFRSRPMRAYWRGVSAVGWKGPKPMDLAGFMSVVLSASADTNIRERLEEKNYALLAASYLNLSSRMGFHFAVIDSFLNEETDSHVSITFYGGGAELVRRIRRIAFLSRVLRHLDFRVECNDDALSARIDGYDLETLEERLEVLGRLMMVSKQLDMVMFSDTVAEHYAKEFITGGYNLSL